MLVVGQQASAGRGWWRGGRVLLPPCSPRSSQWPVVTPEPLHVWVTHPEAPPRHLSRPLLTAAPGPSPGPAHSPPWDPLGSLLGPTQTGPSFTSWPHSPSWDGGPPPQDSTVSVRAQTPPARQGGSRAADERPRDWTPPRAGMLTSKRVPSSPRRPTNGPNGPQDGVSCR